jgi:heme-degrading monooxygenase HmoA
MYVQVVTYSLDGVSEDEYLDLANDLAPSFSGIPGMQAKVWLEDLDRGRYGAFYLWEDRESMERFLRSDMFEGTSTEFGAVETEGFSILENLTAQTQPGLEIIPPRRRAVAGAGPVKMPGRPAAPAPKSPTRSRGASKAKSKAP